MISTNPGMRRAPMDYEGTIRPGMIMMVLRNPELLERILQYLSGCKTSLISVSLTAKAFSEPAFNVLWYEIYSLWPLFRILPTFERGTDGKYVFTGAIRNEHLQRVLYYAKRIRSLTWKKLDSSAYGNVPRDIVTSTVVRLDKLDAFISLRKIHLHDRSKHPILFPFTPPNLDHLEITNTMWLRGPELESNEIALATFLQSATSQSPFLRTLVIEGSQVSHITLQVLPDFINLERLTLHCPHIPLLFLKQLASSMPSLRDLRFDDLYIQYTFPNIQPHPTSRLSFPSLETLKVGCNSAHLANLLGDLDAPLLKSLLLTLPQSDLDTSAEMQKFVERIGQATKDKVHKLVIKSAFNPSLRFIKSFEQVRELVVSTSFGTISMSHIVDTFNYDGLWSHSLTHLRLEQLILTNPFSSMSIVALYFVADACPNLKSLQISIVHPDKPEKPMVVKKDGRKPHNLEYLQFFNLPGMWDDTMPLAIELVSLLGYLFPSMAVPDYTGRRDKPLNELARRDEWWKGVQNMWRVFQIMTDRKMSSICRCSD